MSEENTPEVIEEGDFAKLKKAHAAELAARDARLAELEPLAVEKAVRGAGFREGTPEWNTLTKFAPKDADADSVKNLAAELGFEATPEPAERLNPNEQAAAILAARGAQISSVTTSSNEPQDINQQIADLNAALSAARAARNWDEVKAIGEQLMVLNTVKMRASVASHV